MLLKETLILILFCTLLSIQEGRAQSAAKQKIRGLAVQQVLSFCPTCDVVVESKWMPAKIAQLDSTKIRGLQFTETGLPRGYQTATVFFIRDGSQSQERIQLFIRVNLKVLVTNRRIARNQTINETDLSWQTKDITRMHTLPVVSKSEIAGKAVSRMIPEGSMILESDLQKEPIVKAGDQVRLVYSQGGIEIAIDCTARQSKAKGEDIRLYSRETGKTYIGKVLTPSKIIWEKTL
ncbi:MAG: flagellar basal body P-ring formation chaperone FlgA [Balneolaceae bacterium]|jgi:flagella basal body P-ring formation protein FlgA